MGERIIPNPDCVAGKHWRLRWGVGSRVGRADVVSVRLPRGATMIVWLITGTLLGAITRTALAVGRRSRRSVWRTVFDFRSHEGHVLPLHDLVDHPEDEDCICGPTCEAHQRDDGGTSWLYIHHSLDGRESLER